MSDSDVALVAAVSAAVASLVVAVITVASARRNEARSAHRSILGPFLEELGQHIAGVMATSRVFLRRVERSQDVAPWRNRMEHHAQELKSLRARARYPLYGIEDGIRALSRVASWVQHFQTRVVYGEELLSVADKLRERLDRVVAKSYRRGQPPSWLDRRRVAKQAKEVEELWTERMGTMPDD